MPLYEHVFLARQDVSQQQVETMTKEFSDIITNGGGKITKTEYWGLKGLGYKIKKSRKAHYSLLNIDSPPAAVAEMERLMGLAPDVLRFLTVKVEEHETEPSIMMRKQDREERGDRGGFGGGDRGGDRGGGRSFGGGGREGGGGFRGPPREGGAGAGGGFRGDREGGSTFRPRPPRDAGAPGDAPRPPRDAAAGAGDAPRGPRPPRAPRNDNPGSEG
ncbi:MAG: 30S ribosomal protein S6 [Hyphomicrobium sp.]